MRKSGQYFLFIGSILLMLAVIMGAIGAHIVAHKSSPIQLSIYETAVRYQFYHSFALLIVGLLLQKSPGNKWLIAAGILFIVGLLCFCGSLYTITLAETSTIAMLAPVGGSAFIFGWLTLAISTFTLNAD